MKRNFLFLLSFVMILMTACSQNDEITDEVNNSALAKAEMTYEQYLKGYTLEEVMAPKDEKTPTKTPETIADEELMALIKDSLEGTYSKTLVRTRAIGELLPYMGVFKVKTCGNYPELQVFMDCEDGGWTNVKGVNGLSPEKNFPFTYVDGYNNIWMTFCLVLQDENFMVPVGTGALYFVGGNASLIQENAKRLVTTSNFVDPNDVKNMPRMTFVERRHDNEDHSNKNKAIYKCVTVSGTYNTLGDKYPDFTPRPTYVGEKNTLLTWMFPTYKPINEFHPGFSYGVLTQWNDYNFVLDIDDENGRNTNSAYKVIWSRAGTGYHRSQNSSPYDNNYMGISTTANTVYKVKVIM